ncbi:MAG: exodeoxyribonuclease V subunit gamma [Anaerolineae bacterium]|nr:exodeoxyribonuclease V subunit gamma [Anaerolineae bacterium]
MPTEFLLASVGAGKTEVVQARLLAFKKARPFDKAWCLLATERQIYAFRQRLISRPDALGIYFNVEFFNFYPLYRHILELAGKPQRVLDNAARYRLLRLILAELESDGELELFGKIAGTPGLVRILADFIYELKQNLIDHRTFGEAARTAKDRDLARIYTRYQELLMRYDLVDREGEGWRALDELEDNHYLARDVGLLAVDGYDQFNTLQGQFLTLLAGRADDTLITLTTVPGRETTIGQRFQRALDRLIEYHRQESVVYRIHRQLETGGTRPPALRSLVDRIFQSGSSRAPADQAAVLLEAPDPAGEVGIALRRVKALILAGAAPDDILIAVRDWPRYAPYVEAQARAYGLAVSLDIGSPLAENAAIRALTNLLDLHRRDFRRRELLDVLRSAYFVIPDLGAAEVDYLERLSQSKLILGGRQEWLAALEHSEIQPLEAEDEEDEASADDTPQVSPDQVRAALTAFFDAVTPPPHEAAAAYAAWLEDLIGLDPVDDTDDQENTEHDPAYSLSMIAAIRSPALGTDHDRIVARDLTALQEVKRLLSAMLSAHRLFSALEMKSAPGWDAFHTDLLNAVRATDLAQRTGRDGRVLVTTVVNARGLPHKHVILLGLSEGVFPARIAEDLLYLDSERRTLQARGIALSTQAERADDDGLFYEMISLATESVALTRATVENGAPLPPSHLWRAFDAVYDGTPVQTIRVGAVVPLAQAASLRELALATADSLMQGNDRDAANLAWYAAAYPDQWAQLRHARAVEARRMSNRPHDRFSGRLQSAVLIASAAERLNDRVWSASQLNDYGICAFRFFAKRLLKLEPLLEPEDGMDAAQLGTLYHEILEHTYRQLAEENLAIVPQSLPRALELLEANADALLADAPARIGFRAPSLWETEREVLMRRLRSLVHDDFDETSKAHQELAKLAPGERRPYHTEMPFGDGGVFTLDLGDERLRLRGVIDRIDRAGDRAIVVDYKSGRTTIPVSEIERGRNFQMMIYLLAANQALQGRAQVAGGLFWHIASRSTSGTLQPDDDAIEAGKTHLRRYLERGRAGIFTGEASKIEDGKCSRYCDYSQLCRFSIMRRRKPDA